jgi:hypothetical protein
MKNKSINIIFGILMIAALIGGVMLASQNQETRRGAYFAGTKMLIMPENITAKTGSNLVAQLFLDTENGAKLSALDTYVCYDKGLELNADKPENQIVLNTDALKDLVDVTLENVGDKPCVRIVALAGATMKPDSLKSGMIRILNIRFKATEVADGKITILADKTKVGGYNPAAGATDNSLKVGTVSSADYSVTSGGTIGCSSDSDCADNEHCDSASKTCKPDTGTDGCTSDSDCADNERCDTTTRQCKPTTGAADDTYLKFKMAFYGVRGDALCADAAKLPLSVTVRSNDGVVKNYAGIISTKTNTSGDVGIYEVKMRLNGFKIRNNIAVFVKGPKSLQVKYGVNNQSSYYSVAGGELTGLTNEESSTPMFDFTKYPLLSGDVTGPNKAQDGVVDGLDFSYIKTESIKRTEVASGGYMLADMNGNCKMESQDVANMMLSLSVKQGQLY